MMAILWSGSKLEFYNIGSWFYVFLLPADDLGEVVYSAANVSGNRRPPLHFRLQLFLLKITKPFRSLHRNKAVNSIGC
jgi:hypothetical protein